MIVVLGQTQDDMLSGGDAGDTIDSATLIEIDSGNGFEGFPDQYDWYKIAVVKDQEISVRLTSNTGYFSLELYDTNQQRVDQVSHDGGDSPPVLVTWTATKPGFFYVLSKHFYGSYDPYSLLIIGMATPNVPPTAAFVWWTEDGVLYADASGSVDSDGYIASYLWYIDDTHVVDSAEGMTWSWGSLAPGVYELSLRVVDGEDEESDLVVHSVEVTTPPRADAWIIEVKSSDNVVPGGIISVNVTVGYIFDLETVIGPGIWDPDTSSYLKEIEDSVSGEGTETYTLVFEAPLSAGVYSFTTDIPYQTEAGWVWGNESRHVFLINVIDYSSDYVEITDLQFPSSVQAGADIQVFISISYELSDDTVAFGILDLDTENIQTASMIPITGTGTQTVELSFTAPTIEGTYDYYVSVGPLEGESVDDVFQVTVTPSVEIHPVASFEWWMDEEDALNFDATESTDDGEVVGYIWYKDGEVIEDSYDWDEWYWNGPDEGTYNITLIVVDDMGLESTAYTEIVTVQEAVIANQPPVAIFEWEITGETLKVDASDSRDPDGEILSWVWYIDGSIDNSLDSDIWAWEGIPDGTYTVTLEVTDDMGLEDTYRATIEVEETPSLIPGPSTGSIILGLAAASLVIGSRKGKNTLNTGQSKVF